MQTHNPGVEFEYTVPNENATNNKKQEFSWEYMDWSHCTVSCGGGKGLSSSTKQIFVCTRAPSFQYFKNVSQCYLNS